MATGLDSIWKIDWKLSLQGYMKITYQSLFVELMISISQGANPVCYGHKKREDYKAECLHRQKTYDCQRIFIHLLSNGTMCNFLNYMYIL